MSFAYRLLSAGCLIALLVACGEDAVDDGPDDPPAEVAWQHLDCDPIAPSYCGFPFPSNVFTVDDPTTPTGRRVQLAEAMLPISYYDVVADPTPWGTLDGFSTGSGIMVHVPGLSPRGLPGSDAIEASLADDSPTILLDAETGERVAHFAELDATTADAAQRVLFVRPAQKLKDGTRYIVALRELVGEGGDTLEASPEFAALRDGTEAQESSTEDRRPLYTDIFQRLTDAGVERASLQLAWDFTTASTESTTGWLVHMRDEALAAAGAGGPAYAITEVDPDFAPESIAMRLAGTFEAPMYLTQESHGGLLMFGDDGMPEPMGTLSVPFTVVIPKSAETSPAALMQFGHGLLGKQTEIERDEFHTIANDLGYVIFATDWIGLTTEEQAFLGSILAGGNIQEFQSLFDRLSQSMVNQWLLMRVMSQGLATDAEYGSFIDAASRYYYGISLGGINGGVYTALSTDVERAVLDVPGAPFGLLMTRAALFDPFFDIARSAYPDPRDIHFVLALVQMLWDRIEPIGYLDVLAGHTLIPGTPAHEVMLRVAIGDHSVTPIGAHIMARSLAATHITTGTRDIYGLTTAMGSATGNTIVEYDFGVPPEPVCMMPSRACENPHGGLRALPPADQQLDRFLRTGTAENLCPAGVCSFPERSGCTADNNPGGDVCGDL